MNRHLQAGSSLIEVLVAVLLLAFGILALGVMLSFTVQMPKLSGYRATAVNLASSYTERMRANPDGFKQDKYKNDSSYDGLQTKFTIPDKLCDYPDCDVDKLAKRDFEEMKVAVRAELPAGGLFMLRDSSSSTASTTDGNLWIVWQEPSTFAALNRASLSDNCPTEVTDKVKDTDSKPRCLYVRFKL